MLSREVLLCLLFCPVVFTCIYLWGSVHHLFALGKSKTKVKKDKRTISFAKKMLLIGYAERCDYHTSTAKRLCYIYWGYFSITFICIIFLILSTKIPVIEELFWICVLAKVFVFDVPVNIYGFIMTKHDKINGGVTWVWTDKG